jgi:outer membrane protein TolC
MPHRAGEVPDLDPLVAALPEHPAVLVQERASEVARADVALARQSYRPDWSLEVGYGYRPEFSEMVTVRATVDLPFFRGQRQDRELAAARRDVAAAEARREDRLRELSAQLASIHDEWRFLASRAETFERELVPQAHARVEAATAAYRAGRGTLAESLAARRALLDIESQALELALEREHRRVELAYFAP